MGDPQNGWFIMENGWFRGPPISGNFHLGSRTPADKSQLRFHPEHRHHRPQRAHHPECNRIRPETVRIHGFFAMGLSHHEISLGIAMDSLYKLHYPQLLIIKKTGGNHGTTIYKNHGMALLIIKRLPLSLKLSQLCFGSHATVKGWDEPSWGMVWDGVAQRHVSFH